MRDIGTRIQRYRLSRYGRVGGATFRWAWPLLFLWLIYATLLGEHSLLRIWRMGRESARLQGELLATRGELDRLEKQLSDPSERKRIGEHTLRERNGFVKPGEILYRIPAADSAAR
jgi:cell division protein FtsB